MRCCVVFCFMLICFEFGIVDGLKSSQKGVCISKHTVTKTRPRTVLVATSKWCGNKKCTVKQTRKQKYTVVTNQLMCCKGFVYTSGTDSCAPVCSTGCANGTCVDPDVCLCAAPLYLDPTTKNKCLSPTCDQPCINGICTANNTCICAGSFVYFNATHCVENCTDGFELNSSLKCVPKCKCDGCVGNKCVCLPGYKNGTCEPQCDRCVNARCVARDTCECLKGFARKNATVCERSCGECRANGTCLTTTTETKTRPVTYHETVPCEGGTRMCTETKTRDEEYKEELAVCCDTYTWVPDRDICEPNCERGCTNGTCVAPDVCVCKPPLILNDAAAVHTCMQPICDQPCVHGTCTANNKCTCDDGYTIKDTYTCVAQCTNCTNGDCVKPNVCNCHVGYLMNDGQCTPQCESCSNGVCSAPDICTCNYGYERIDNKCKPVCKKPCVNGDCIAPNNCQCKEGYEAKSGNKEVCKPKCKSDCSNGFCSSPNVCTCNDGYEFKDNKCKPICKKPCLYGECVAPDTCKCFDGYESKGKHKEICVPKCKNNCSHGICTGPDVCICNPGYELKESKCTPVCNKTCINATCVAPDTCECLEGFEKAEHEETCKPKCKLCDHGVCIAPNKCECKKGYYLTDKGCIPNCKETCVNGYCSAPNKCSCNEGYTRDTLNSSVCKPKCKSECSNGFCSSPNVCTCNDGYEFKDNKCKPICKKPCLYGECVAPNTCKCFDGYESKGKHKEICVPKCKNNCSHGICAGPDVCICNPGYELKESKCTPVCNKTCTNATCVAPDTCECLEGFEKAEHEEICKPKCKLCAHGVCIAPNKCECKKGYYLTDKGCIPNCKETCVNGYCSAPNKCSCNEGYTRDTLNSSVCSKPCDVCNHGTCKAGVCVCEAEMDFVNGTCVVSTPSEISGITATTGLASVQMTWLVGGAVVLLLTVLVLVVIGRLWHNRKEFPQKADDGQYGSVAYTAPNTLFRRPDSVEEEEPSDTLLEKETNVV